MVNFPGVIDERIGDAEASDDQIWVGACDAQKLDSEGTMQLRVPNRHWEVAAAFLHNLTTSVQFPAAHRTVRHQDITVARLCSTAK